MMKKLTLALVLALGVASVQANVTTSNVPADLENRIKSLNLNQEEQAGVLNWVSNNKVVTGLAAAAVLGGTFYGVDRYMEWGYCDAANAKVAEYYTTYAPEIVKNNPKTLAAGVATAVALIYAAYDLNKAEDKSSLKALYASLLGKTA